nr:MAG TPA: hypothetical protein [Bacteriophage sp.]
MPELRGSRPFQPARRMPWPSNQREAPPGWRGLVVSRAGGNISTG